MGSEKGGLADLREELYDAKAAIGRVVMKKGLMADFSEVGWGILSYTSGDGIDEHFAPLDIGTGGEGSGCQQGDFYSTDNNVMSSL